MVLPETNELSEQHSRSPRTDSVSLEVMLERGRYKALHWQITAKSVDLTIDRTFPKRDVFYSQVVKCCVCVPIKGHAARLHKVTITIIG